MATQNKDRTFTTGEAARYASVPHRTVDSWAKTGIVTPSVADTSGSGITRLYTFGDVVALRCVRELRNLGLPLDVIRAVVACLKEVDFTKPLRQSKVLAVGSKAYWVDDCQQVEALLRRGDGVALIMDIEQTKHDVQTEIKAA